MIRLLAFVAKPSGQSPGQRFRLEQWAPHLLEKHDIELDFVPFESPRLTEIIYQKGHLLEKTYWILYDALRRREAVTRAHGYDGAVIFREAAAIGPAVYERLLAHAGIPFFYDFDDAIWAPTGSQSGAFSMLRFRRKTATICRLARAVMVGNEYLADYARQYNPRTYVVPTSIELDRYPLQPRPCRDDPFTIVWSGSLHTLVHLEMARGSLERLGLRRKIVLRVIGNQPLERPFANVDNLFVPWQEQGEAEAIGAGHVGIMPLPEDPFARGKCGLKGLQYMAVGMPAVMSPVGVNVDIVDHGRNGMLARSEDEWVDVLDCLASSPELCAKLGAAGRLTVEERYSANVAAAQFADVVRRTLS